MSDFHYFLNFSLQISEIEIIVKVTILPVFAHGCWIWGASCYLLWNKHCLIG